jgi:hypothetical protein
MKIQTRILAISCPLLLVAAFFLSFFSFMVYSELPNVISPDMSSVLKMAYEKLAYMQLKGVEAFNSKKPPIPISPYYPLYINQSVVGKLTLNRTTEYNKKIAFVEPTFTYAAYQNSSFYNFYYKYFPRLEQRPPGSIISNDLYLLKDRPIPHGPFPYFAHPSSTPDIPYKFYFDTLLQHVKKYDPNITNLTDVDVDQGKIFQTKNNSTNAYDVLFLFHCEYVTQAEYNSLKQFVKNGGTIVFTEGNVLFAEVAYNKANDSVTLVKGHYIGFDGVSAKWGVGERWLNENKEWMGSNFLDIDSTVRLFFRNNPFNYTHSEEQYVTNPHAKILKDYGLVVPRNVSDYEKYANATVGTYEMNYGKGKVINLGIWGHTLSTDRVFLEYIDRTIIPLALAPRSPS